jgi:hypothetical protein
VKTRAYPEVFYGLDGKTFPGFHDLLHRIKLPKSGDTEQLPEDVGKTVTAQLAPIYQVCRDRHFRPLLSEFALISDTRSVGPAIDPFFSSYISVFLRPAMEVAEAYGAALRYMATPEAGNVQIVPHPELFESKTVSIQASCASYVQTESHGDTPVSEDPVCLVGLRQRFELLQDPGVKLAHRVEVFLQAFFRNLLRYPSLNAIAEKLAGSEFLLLPFVRPGYDSAAFPQSGTVDREHFRSYPGGALFLFLEPEQRPRTDEQLQADLDEVSRALSWLMAESSIRESYALLEVEENRKRNSISYSITHPLKNRLTALDSNTELLMSSYYENASDFETRLKLHWHRVQSIHWFADLAHMLHYAATKGPAETLAARERDGALRFGATGPLDLNRLLTDEALNASVELTCAEELHPVIEGFEQVDGIPLLVRLQDDLYREIVYELIANVRRHSAVENGVRRAIISMCEIEGVPALVLTNTVDERTAMMGLDEPVNIWTRWNSASPRGLSFVKVALASTLAGDVFYKDPRTGDQEARTFSVAVTMRGLQNKRAIHA